MNILKAICPSESLSRSLPDDEVCPLGPQQCTRPSTICCGGRCRGLPDFGGDDSGFGFDDGDGEEEEDGEGAGAGGDCPRGKE